MANERILVVSGDRPSGERLAGALADAGYTVDTEADGLDGLTLARRLAPGLVVCDAGAPRLAAIDLCRTMRHEPGLSATYVIAVGPGDAIERAALLDAGADDVIELPVDDATLVARVRAGLRGRGATRAETSARRLAETRERAVALATDVNNALMALVGHLALARQYLDRAETPRAQAHVDDARRAAERIADATQVYLVECERAAATGDRA